MKRCFAICVLAVGFAAAGVQDAAAQVSTYMLVPNIQGGSTVRGHEKWIDVMSLRQSLTNPPGKRTSSCSIEVVKALDIAGPKLWAAAVTGQFFGDIKIDVMRATGDGQSKLYEVHFLGAHVLSIETDVSAAAAERLTLSADLVTLTFFTQNADGSSGGPSSSASVACN